MKGEEQYICKRSEGCKYTECAHRTPHGEYECHTPEGHRSAPPLCGVMPEFTCVPVNKLEKEAAAS